jgi:hypothetical protein
MRNVLLAMAIVSLISCTKESVPAVTEKSDYELRRIRQFPNGQTTTDIQAPIQPDHGSHVNAELDVLNENTVLWIGGSSIDGNPRITASVVFKGQTDPLKIAGTYRFPADLAKADVFFNEHTSANETIIRSNPNGGSVTISYNAQTKTWSGTLNDVSLGVPLGATYTSEIIRGRFDRAPLRTQ